MPWYAWRHDGIEGVLRAASPVQAAALAAKRLGAIGQKDHPRVVELGGRLYRVVSGDGRREVVVELFHLGNRRPEGYVRQGVGERETRTLSDRAALAVISRYLQHGGTPDGADALWQLHERYIQLYGRR
jgi:hypothetical protein